MNKIEIVIDRPEQDRLISELVIDGYVSSQMASWYPNPVKIEDVKKAVSLMVSRCFEVLEEEGVESGKEGTTE